MQYPFVGPLGGLSPRHSTSLAHPGEHLRLSAVPIRVLFCLVPLVVRLGASDGALETMAAGDLRPVSARQISETWEYAIVTLRLPVGSAGLSSGNVHFVSSNLKL